MINKKLNECILQFLYCYYTIKNISQLKESQIKKLIITDTIDNSKKIKISKKIEVISFAPMISEAIKRISNSTSVSSLFK